MYFDLRLANAERDRLALYKALSPQNLTGYGIAHDSNVLNRAFYDELLYIIGVEEVRVGAKRTIQRVRESKRSPGSLIELTLAQLTYSDVLNTEQLITQYGADRAGRAYEVALELCLTWVNRLLFLKLLEAQLVRFHGGSVAYEFLNSSTIQDFAELSNLFFLVLALERGERPDLVRRFDNVPYLNSSLFERSPLERLLDISALGARGEISPPSSSVLRDRDGRRPRRPVATLEYVLRFLAAYDFGSAAGGEIRENSKPLISASVLGLIFEKINGYQEGAVFTPGLVTMNMSRRVIEASVLDAFRAEFPDWNLGTIDDLRNSIVDRSSENILRLNGVVDRIRVCDPAVGSGHFLVSCLNEFIALKSRLGILADSAGRRIIDYAVHVDNDELVVVRADSSEVFSYRVVDGHVPAAIQHVQATLFEEKRKLIEGCLFGVDINQNSVGICRLRLWIELLKNAYYRDNGDGDLETLPNIDINIKRGDSLLSRFALTEGLSSAFRSAGLTVRGYRELVELYKETRNKDVKAQLQGQIATAKQRFQNEALDRLTRQLNAEIARLRAQEAQLNLFVGEHSEPQRSDLLERAREEITKLESRREAERRRQTYMNALEWRFEFPEILDGSGDFLGFDIVIGNPPYGVPVQGDRREIATKNLGKVPDFEIYYMFLNLGRRLLRDGGRLSYIVPNMILSNVHARNYRLSMLEDWRDLEVDDLTEYKVFADAVVHNVILTGRKGQGSVDVLFRRTGKAGTLSDYLDQPQEAASRSLMESQVRNWGLVFRHDQPTAELIATIAAGKMTLRELFPEVSQGLIAYDSHQGQDELTIKQRVFHTSVSSERTSKWLNGEDVRRYAASWGGVDYIEYGSWLANPRKPKFFNGPRLLIREITNPRIFAAYMAEEAYNDPSIINVLPSQDDRFPLHALLAILNSKLATFYHFNSSPKALKGAFPKILVDDVRAFPLPDPGRHGPELQRVSSLATEIQRAIAGETDVGQLPELEAEIDEVVYGMYGLQAGGVALIERWFDTPNATE